MQVAQGLYEQGLITYHRTDSVNLAKQAIFAARGFIEKEYGKNYLPDTPRIYKTKSKVAQEAHEAIRPTDIKLKIENFKLKIGRDESRLYSLIWKRMVACQMREAIFEETKVDIEAGSFLFRAMWSELKFDGWKKIYGKDEEKENKLPFLEIGNSLKLIKLLPSQHFTEPPPRYTEATLIKALEERGIGRPSTYAPIISTIQERQYVEKLEKKFTPTPLGEVVNDFLVSNFSDIVDVGFTAKMEDDLDSIARGENQWIPVIADFYEPFEKNLEEAQKKGRVKVPVEETEEKCEKCGAPMVIRIGKFGKFLACSRFPECDFTKPYLNKTGLR
ncbi:MAG: DNA topoisomerase I [Microgenomates group bacterium LiPW_16]|nr:MAG: DNA topoisomerase I [Microgenomates group bacterium LiPW_16]